LGKQGEKRGTPFLLSSPHELLPKTQRFSVVKGGRRIRRQEKDPATGYLFTETNLQQTRGAFDPPFRATATRSQQHTAQRPAPITQIDN
jgi:hypothetical protein